MVKTPKCQKCDSTEKVKPIVYGLPSQDLIKAGERNEVILGGCTVGVSDCNWGCGKCGIRWKDYTMYEVEHSEDETPIDKDETFLDKIEKLLFHKNQVVSTVSFIIVAPVFLFMMALLFISMEIRIFFEDR